MKGNEHALFAKDGHVVLANAMYQQEFEDIEEVLDFTEEFLRAAVEAFIGSPKVGHLIYLSPEKLIRMLEEKQNEEE